ncbi:prolipoprotein diacylglyceryl transferase [Thalassobius sp. S69A]|uniref:prolipoprotein diacylglyceryl transferase n=1 Tax=unclassified Thalassovita TaxID=2619711 RepID=UPI000C117BBD|nr:prolipoprotein diacylglyceryl transferase [Paracoccaceae bacterium]MBT25424.1 prolipoprotein diacylglyceryl transferase [Paracoccaceae bacterium]
MTFAIPFPQISPEIFSISLFGIDFALRWYALAYIAGILIGWRLVLSAIRRPALWRDGPPMTAAQVEDLLTWMILGIILGGRLGFVLFYRPGYYLDHPAEILQIWSGGMSFHGGFLGVVIAALIFTKRHNIPRLPTADLLALAVPIGLMLGRIANFINAELWGRPTDLPWGVVFPGASAQACEGVVGLCARHPSQLYEAFLEGVVLASVLLWLAFRSGALKKPGLLLGVFLTGYGLARVIVEHFRQADDQFITLENPMGHILRLGEWGLTMGQLLSLPMVAVGLGVLFYVRRSK